MSQPQSNEGKMIFHRLYWVLLIGSSFFLSSCSNHEEVACNLVTDILKENFGETFDALGMETAECKAVELGEPVRSRYYHNAKAYLDNGKTLRIIVEVKWDSVYVQIPNESIIRDD